MKKLVAFLLALTLIFCFCACKKKTENGTADKGAKTSQKNADATENGDTTVNDGTLSPEANGSSESKTKTGEDPLKAALKAKKTVSFTVGTTTYVCTHDGKNVTGEKRYKNMDTPEAAQNFYDACMVDGTFEAMQNDCSDITVDGKYVVYTVSESGYVARTYDELIAMATLHGSDDR